jgi:hypothetical protein
VVDIASTDMDIVGRSTAAHKGVAIVSPKGPAQKKTKMMLMWKEHLRSMHVVRQRMYIYRTARAQPIIISRSK